MKHRTILLSILAMMMMPAWAGGAKEEIASKITQLYDAIAKRAEGGTSQFACKNWWKTVAEVEKKDETAEEIGFFNDDLWTQMQDDNPDRFEVRDLKFVQFDEQKARHWWISACGARYRPYIRGLNSAAKMAPGAYTTS